MTTPIHVLCSNFTEIVRREVGETIRCNADKKGSRNAEMRVFFGAILRPFGKGRQTFARSRAT